MVCIDMHFKAAPGGAILPAILMAALLLGAPTAQAQTYKWTGADGRVHYTDTPPPASARRVESKAIGGESGAAAELPYELADAARKHPVVLYTTPNCTPCTLGRALLTKRGIPFNEKIVTSSEDIAALRAAGGAQQLPFLTIGRQRQAGFEPDGWNAALSAAGYPGHSKLPRDYQHAAAEPAAARTAPEDARADAPAPTPPAKPAAPATTPPGFRF